MSWLDELEYVHRYVCECGYETHRKLHAKEKFPEFVTCEDCGKPSKRAGLIPIKLGGHTAVQYEKNGRVAYRITDSNGMVQHVSATKRNYLNSGKIQSRITKEYAGVVQDNTEREFRKNERQQALARESNASVSGAGKSSLSDS